MQPLEPTSDKIKMMFQTIFENVVFMLNTVNDRTERRGPPNASALETDAARPRARK
jgi:hypothetical protein